MSTDVQVGGRHYADMAVQPIEFIVSNGLGFCEGNVIKYICRWRAKNGVEDLEKARQYLGFIVDYHTRWTPIMPSVGIRAMSANDFIAWNGIQNPEAGVIRHIYGWHYTRSYDEIAAALNWLGEAQEAAER